MLTGIEGVVPGLNFSTARLVLEELDSELHSTSAVQVPSVPVHRSPLVLIDGVEATSTR